MIDITDRVRNKDLLSKIVSAAITISPLTSVMARVS